MVRNQNICKINFRNIDGRGDHKRHKSQNAKALPLVGLDTNVSLALI